MDYGIAMARTDGQFVIWNKRACEILGKKEADVGSENWSEHYGIHYTDAKKIVPEDDLPLVKAMKGKHVEKQELLIITENMKDRIIVCDADPIIHDGKIMGGVVVFRDITKEKAVEKKLKDMLKNLEDLKNYQDKMLKRMSQ
jgi:PAS domain S-box-containing protein